jgi:hypothetical protein
MNQLGECHMDYAIIRISEEKRSPKRQKIESRTEIYGYFSI